MGFITWICLGSGSYDYGPPCVTAYYFHWKIVWPIKQLKLRMTKGATTRNPGQGPYQAVRLLGFFHHPWKGWPRNCAYPVTRSASIEPTIHQVMCIKLFRSNGKIWFLNSDDTSMLWFGNRFWNILKPCFRCKNRCLKWTSLRLTLKALRARIRVLMLAHAWEHRGMLDSFFFFFRWVWRI